MSSNDVTTAETPHASNGKPAAGAADPPPTVPGDPGRGGRTPSREIMSSSATALAFALIFAVYAVWLQGGFFDVTRLSFDISRSAPQIALAVAVVVCLSGHQFDLSVAMIATGACFAVVGLHVDAGLPMGWALAITILMGLLAGLINGILVTALNVSAFIATLGTGGLFAGLTVVYSSGNVIGPTVESGPLPGWFSGAGSVGDFQNKVPALIAVVLIVALVGALLVSIDQRFPGPEARRRTQVAVLAVVGAGVVGLAAALGVPTEMDWSIFIVLTLALVVWIVMKYTAVGHAIYAVGGNASAAAFAGIRTRRVQLSLFVFSGTISAVAGVLIAAQQGSAAPGVANPLLLPAYAGAFLSTVLLSRGGFHVWGAAGGSIALVYVTDGLVVGGVPYTWTEVINGAVLITAVALSTILVRRSGR